MDKYEKRRKRDIATAWGGTYYIDAEDCECSETCTGRCHVIYDLFAIVGVINFILFILIFYIEQ